MRSNPNYPCPTQQPEPILLKMLSDQPWNHIAPTPQAIHHRLLGGGERRGSALVHLTWVGDRSVGSWNDKQCRVPSYVEGISRRLGGNRRAYLHWCITPHTWKDEPWCIGLGVIAVTRNKSELGRRCPNRRIRRVHGGWVLWFCRMWQLDYRLSKAKSAWRDKIEKGETQMYTAKFPVSGRETYKQVLW